MIGVTQQARLPQKEEPEMHQQHQQISTYGEHAIAALEEMALAIRALKIAGHEVAARELQLTRDELAETLQSIGSATIGRRAATGYAA